MEHGSQVKKLAIPQFRSLIKFLVWLSALERQRAIASAIEMAEDGTFEFDQWRQRYMGWMNHKKSRVMETMRKMDKSSSGFINNEAFVKGVCESGFDTNEREMKKV